MNHHIKTTLAAAAMATMSALPPAHAQENAEATYADIQQTLGFVPDFFKVMPEKGISGVWALVKKLEMNPDTALDGKTKALISLGVAAQIPCQYCIYADLRSARAEGATEQEIREAVGMAGLTRLASTLLNGLEVDMPQFKKDFDRLLAGE